MRGTVRANVRRRYVIDPSTGKRVQARGFTPFKPDTSPPPGTYDPSLDQSLAGAQRGYGDLQQDTEKGLNRAGDDYILSTGEVTKSRDRALQDLSTQRANLDTNFNRGLADLGTERTRAQQDYSTSLSGLARQYTRLGDSQAQGAEAAGVGAGGALAQAAAKRATNEAIDQAPIDQGFGRFTEDANLREQRAREDYANAVSGLNTQQGRIGEDAQSGLGQAGLGLERYTEDSGTTLSRAGRELAQFGLDTNQTKFAQATQSGLYAPPEKPANEHTDPRTGQTFRLVRTPTGRLVRQLSNGQLVRRPNYSLRSS